MRLLAVEVGDVAPELVRLLGALAVEEDVRLAVGDGFGRHGPRRRVVELDPLTRRLVEGVARVVAAAGRAVVHDHAHQVVGRHFRRALCPRVTPKMLASVPRNEPNRTPTKAITPLLLNLHSWSVFATGKFSFEMLKTITERGYI